MSFDDIPEDKQNMQPCPNCADGNAIEDKHGNWHCDTCDWCFIKGDSTSDSVSNSENNQAGYIY